MVFAIGPAGTGKSFLAVAMAVAALTRREAARIVLTRPAVEAGERLGFLPGDLYEKVHPYLRPLYDALYDMLEAEKVQSLMDKGAIEVAPLAYMRGRTLNDAFIILDEAQNSTAEQMKMFLTRLGFNSKMVITGDITQIDLPSSRASGLIEARTILEGVPGISFVYFDDRDVVRHRLVSSIIRAYDAHEAAPASARGVALMPVLVDNRQARVPVDHRGLAHAAQRALADVGRPGGAVEVAVVDDRAIRRLNRAYRGVRAPHRRAGLSPRDARGGGSARRAGRHLRADRVTAGPPAAGAMRPGAGAPRDARRAASRGLRRSRSRGSGPHASPRARAPDARPASHPGPPLVRPAPRRPQKSAERESRGAPVKPARSERRGHGGHVGAPMPIDPVRAGFVALVGRPNAGKSTLLNRLVGNKLAIVSPRPQTTRNRITGIRNLPGAQIVFVDTPGVHEAGGKLGEFMRATVERALSDVDLVCVVVDASADAIPDSLLLRALEGCQVPRLCLLNKIDRVEPKARLLPIIDAWQRAHAFREILPISAGEGTNCDRALGLIVAALPEHPALFPEDATSDQPETFYVAEMIREKVFLLTREEVPYAVAVRVDEMTERPEPGLPLHRRAHLRRAGLPARDSRGTRRAHAEADRDGGASRAGAVLRHQGVPRPQRAGAPRLAEGRARPARVRFPPHVVTWRSRARPRWSSDRFPWARAICW